VGKTKGEKRFSIQKIQRPLSALWWSHQAATAHQAATPSEFVVSLDFS
jgi:hypothetical protein